MSTVVVVPTYQERASICELVDRTRRAAPDVHLLIVDDGSPDGTADVVEALALTDGHVHLLRRSSKDGLGTAYRAGFAWARDAGLDAVVEMDADLSHPPELLPRLVAGLAEADVVIGSRYVDGGRTVGWAWHRRAISRTGNAYVRLALGLTIRDATAGFRAFRTEALDTIDVGALRSNGYCFQVETAYQAHRRGLRLQEHPIHFVERVQGSSKMSGAIVAEALLRVTWWALRDRVFRRPGPAAALPRAVEATRPLSASLVVVAVLLLAGLLAGCGGVTASARSEEAPAETGMAASTGSAAAEGSVATHESTVSPAPAAGTPAADTPAADNPNADSPTADSPNAGTAPPNDAAALSPPVSLRIPAIGVDSAVSGLGVAADGAVEVPGNGDDTGWLESSALPGARGPTVLLGHVDSAGGPGVFRDLETLQVGDVMEVGTETGATVEFAVTGTGRYPKTEFPSGLVYGPAPGPLLRLVTCGGVFDEVVGSHRDNVVVFAVRA